MEVTEKIDTLENAIGLLKTTKKETNKENGELRLENEKLRWRVELKEADLIKVLMKEGDTSKDEKIADLESRIRELESYIDERKDWWAKAADIQRNCNCNASRYYNF